MHKDFEIVKAQAYPLGAHFVSDGLQITAVMEQAHSDHDESEYGVILFDRKYKDGIRIPFPKESRVGAVCSMLLKGYHNRICSYLFYCGARIWQDPYCRKIEGHYKYGTPRETMPRCMVSEDRYEWEEDRGLEIPYEDVILYALHVRGFTKHKSSGVKHKGTYAGLVEKISYLKELGITSVLLMPTYEFDEIMEPVISSPAMTMEQAAASYRQLPEQASFSYRQPGQAVVSHKQPGMEDSGRTSGQSRTGEDRKENICRINYWGYQKGLYYIPKSGYAHSKDAVGEYKDMVKELHRNGIEVLMQFYFPPEISPMEMIDILKYWVLEYHIDGFQVMGVDLPMGLIAREPLLCGTKLLSRQHYDPAPTDYAADTRCIGWLSDSFQYDMRRAVKGDDNMINQLIFHVRNNRPETGIVNYIAACEGMRLSDLVTYDRKHNESNGEDNQDGTDYNCSWNCGVEGKSRRKAIVELRMKQMKNALTFVFLSQGTPLLYGGDEFGNTQEGNNNPYCQDNAVTWIKWNQTETGRELLAYTKLLIELRKKHPILHSKAPLKGMDYLSCGYPDISYHGREAWRPDTGPASRSIGIMYCGYYGGAAGHKDNTLIYIGINLHWRMQRLGMPQLPKGKEWILYASTGQEEPDKEKSDQDVMSGSSVQKAEFMQKICVAPRTIAVYMANDLPDIPDQGNKYQ